MNQPTTSWASLASQRKLLTSFGARARDNLSLHRWVLLKNFVSHIESPDSEPTHYAEPSPIEEEVFVFPDEDVFVFPDILAAADASASAVDEARWLDALLEELDSDDDDDADASADDDFVEISEAATVTFAHPTPPASPVHRTTLPDPDPAISSLSSCTVSAPATPPPSPSFSDDDEFPFPYGHLESYSSDDVSSDEESEGPQTPLMHSAVASDTTPIVSSEPEFYFFQNRSPIHHAPIMDVVVVQDC